MRCRRAEPLESRNRSSLYDAALVRDLAGRLLAQDDIAAGVYPASEIEQLRDLWLA